MGDFIISLPETLHTAIKIAAAKNGILMKDLIIEALSKDSKIKLELD